MFCRYALRTTDQPAARAFYADAIGLALPDGTSEGSNLEAWPLHERALARGAPAHWLGQLAVDDVDATVQCLLERGSEALGPTVVGRDGTSFATLRDPFGAVVGVRARGRAVHDAPVTWHQLHTRDADAAWALYHELFGFALGQTLAGEGSVGSHRLFAWNDARGPVGAISDTARLPGVHPHWLFFFPVGDVVEAAIQVRARGGTAMEPFALPDGTRLVACEDPQGAAFGVTQAA